MGTVADKLNLLLNTKSSIRDAIAAMGQSVAATVSFTDYAAKIRAISSDATAAAADILSGKTAYAGGKKITGTIAGKGVSDLTASGAAVSVPAGYYPEDVSKSVAAAEQAVPGISVSSNGLITASATQGEGYVAAGTKSATQQLATQAAATITPGTSAKTVVAAGRYTTGAVQVAGDANLVAENIQKGVDIFGVVGTLDKKEFHLVKIINNLNQDFSLFCSFCYNLGGPSYSNYGIKANKTASIYIPKYSNMLLLLGGASDPAKNVDVSGCVSKSLSFELIGGGIRCWPLSTVAGDTGTITIS